MENHENYLETSICCENYVRYRETVIFELKLWVLCQNYEKWQTWAGYATTFKKLYSKNPYLALVISYYQLRFFFMQYY